MRGIAQTSQWAWNVKKINYSWLWWWDIIVFNQNIRTLFSSTQRDTLQWFLSISLFNARQHESVMFFWMHILFSCSSSAWLSTLRRNDDKWTENGWREIQSPKPRLSWRNQLNVWITSLSNRGNFFKSKTSQIATAGENLSHRKETVAQQLQFKLIKLEIFCSFSWGISWDVKNNLDSWLLKLREWEIASILYVFFQPSSAMQQPKPSEWVKCSTH